MKDGEFGSLLGSRRRARGTPEDPVPPADQSALGGFSRAVRRGVLVLAAVLAGAATGAIAFAPWLLVEHPLWLAALAPDGANMILVSGSVTFLELAAVAVPMRALGVITAYALGAIYGRVALGKIRFPRVLRFLEALERALERFGPMLLVVLPAYTLGMLAGASRLEPRRAIPAIIAGQVVAVAAAYYLGSLVAPWTAAILAFLEENLLVSTLVCVGLVAAFRLWKRIR